MTTTEQRDLDRGRRRPSVVLAALLTTLVLLVAGCGGSDDSGAGSEASSDRAAIDETAQDPGIATDAAGGADEEAAEAMPPTTVAASAEEGGDTGDDQASGTDAGGESGPLGAGGVTVTPTAADIGRKLIFTAFLTVGVDDVAAASAEATSIIEDLGGFLFGQNTVGGAEPTSELTFKILPDDFNRALELLGSVGELRNQSVTTDDVTERVVDLESRIEVAELGVERLRNALENAGTLEDYAEIERLLLDRESELEVMRGQIRTLQDRIDLATITLLLTQDRVENAISVDVTAYPDHDGGRSCPGQGEISVEEGSEATVCFDLVNVGDQTLTDIVLTDTSLGIDADSELIAVFGSIEELAPGQSALLAFETRPERTLRIRTRVTAIPTDGVSPEPAGPSVTTQVDSVLQTFPSEDSPGFGDGFGVAVDVLKGLWIALTVTIGFLIPLLILLPLVWLAWFALRWLLRRRPQRPPSRPHGGPGGGGGGPGGPGGHQPPPPTPDGPARAATPPPPPPAPEPEPEPEVEETAETVGSD